MAPRLFGLTGGIAAGKSTVASFLRNRGVAVLDADQIAREVVAPGSEGLRRVVESFGRNVLARDGSLDRKALAALVFSDARARRDLEAITHPLIRQRTADLALDLGRQGHAIIAYEAALLVETGQADAFRPLVAVVVDDQEQVARLMKRDGITREQAQVRLAAQMSQHEKAAAADHVIDTTCSRDELRRRTDEVLALVCKACGVDCARFGL
jgi:dephospho-CoA kinase